MKIIVSIFGGLVDWVQTDAREPVEVMIRNLDIEGAPEDEITKGIKNLVGDACVSMESLEPNDPEQEIEFQRVWNHFKPKGA